jgi:predicted lipid-binding transport protein (Tim44 family)
MSVDGIQGSVCPILAEREYQGRRSEPVSASMAQVLVTSKGEHLVRWPHDRTRPTVWGHTQSRGVGSGRIKTVYDVDIGVRALEITATLPGQGAAFSFLARATIEWRVLDPWLVVRNQVQNVQPLVVPVIVDAMKRIASQFAVDQSAAAEHAINDALAGEVLDFTKPQQLPSALEHSAQDDHIGRQYGLWTRTVVALEPDQASLSQSRELQGLRHQLDAEELRQQLRVLQERNEQALVSGRMTFYRDAFDAGDLDRALLQFAQNPTDLPTIVKVLRERELTGQQLTVDFVNKLVDAGVVESWQINDQAKAALEWLKQSTSVVIDANNPAARLDDRTGPRKRIRERSAAALDDGDADR